VGNEHEVIFWVGGIVEQERKMFAIVVFADVGINAIKFIFFISYYL
jgi:hypothetical protein